jgi:hypothetical protein
LLSWPAIPVLGDLLRYTISPILGRLMAPMVYRKLFAPAPVSTRFENKFPLELAVRPSQIRASAAETALMIPGAASLADHYPELSIPIAIMAGRGDKIVSSDRQSGRLSAALRQDHAPRRAGYRSHAPSHCPGGGRRCHPGDSACRPFLSGAWCDLPRPAGARRLGKIDRTYPKISVRARSPRPKPRHLGCKLETT